MKYVRIYQPGKYTVNDIITLSEEASHHVNTVLRMHVGESFLLFSGDNQEIHAIIHAITKRRVDARITAIHTVDRESPQAIHLAQAISKGDRMDWVIQKATELGVTSITPLITTRCVVRLTDTRMDKKISHWQEIAIAACEQSGRNRIPTVHTALAFSQYLKTLNTISSIIFDPKATRTLRNLPSYTEAITLIVGPEGGFTNEEISEAKNAGATAISLGPRILRTETAAILSIGVLQALYGDL